MTNPPHIEHRPAAPNRARGAPLLFVHGAFGSPWMWSRRFMPWFAARGFECWALEFGRALGRDHGRAVEPGLDDYVAELEAAYAAVGGPAVVVAHSLGALVAQIALARIRPIGLAMLAPAPPTGMIWSSLRLAVDDPMLWSQVMLATAGSGTIDAACTAEAMLAPGAPAGLVRETHRQLRAQPARPVLEAQWPRAVPGAARLGVPAIVLAAGEDRLIPAASVALTARRHGAAHHTVEGSGHALMLDRAWESAASLLLDWLESGAIPAAA